MTARLLLVEDDPVSCDLLASLLTCRGYAVDQAGDGFTGLRMAQDQAYDLVFVDYHLPEMDGYAFARLMRSLAERGERKLAMVAITADRFGLAARRGVDGVFDRLLAKPIDPDELYACVDQVLVAVAAADVATNEIDAFLAEPTDGDAHSASQVLWRVRGLGDRPSAAIFPKPTPAELTALGYCFKIAKADTADCLVLLSEAGLAEVAALRSGDAPFLKPLLTIGDKEAGIGDAAFKVGDAESWSAVASLIKRFKARTALLRAEVRGAADLDQRLLAYLFVRDTPLTLRRDTLGATTVVNASGFESGTVIDAVKRLAAKGFVGARPMDLDDSGTRALSVFLTDKGQASLVDARSAQGRSGIV